MGGMKLETGERIGVKTIVERRSDVDLFVTRRFSAPAALVYKAWSNADLFRQWWVPRSMGMRLLNCEMDVRTGGGYRLEFAHPSGEGSMAFFGRYIDVVVNSRIVWTNEENGGGAVTTVTFKETDGTTLLIMHERYPSKEELDQSFEGMEASYPEQFDQLEEMLAGM